MHIFKYGFIAITLLLNSSMLMAQESLLVNLMFSSGNQRTFFVEKIKQFEKDNPTIKVSNKEYEQAKYKESFEGWLKSPTAQGDVLFWFAGEKLKTYVTQGLVEPLDDLWAEKNYDAEFTKGSKSAVMADGKVYGLPMSYYQWGFYYRKTLFEKNKISEPQSWEEFLKACEILKTAGIIPITLGDKEPWTAAGWFDYLNLRINGLDFHMDLLKGKVAWTDEKIKEVFKHWGELVTKGYILENHAENDWRQALPFLYREKAAMLLMGNFVVPQIPEKVLPDFGFFRFPKINAKLGYYEEAPLDVLVVPKNSANKPAAKKFLAFMARPEVQFEMNNAMGMISPNSKAKESDDRFIRAGAKTLGEAQGISQFFDRDTIPEIFNPGMEAMAKFLKNPQDLDKILSDMEAVRKKVYKL